MTTAADSILIKTAAYFRVCSLISYLKIPWLYSPHTRLRSASLEFLTF